MELWATGAYSDDEAVSEALNRENRASPVDGLDVMRWRLNDEPADWTVFAEMAGVTARRLAIEEAAASRTNADRLLTTVAARAAQVVNQSRDPSEITAGVIAVSAAMKTRTEIRRGGK